MDYDFIHEVVGQMNEDEGRQFIIRPDMAVIRSGVALFKMMKSKNPPFFIHDYRMGYVVKGWIRAEFNLVERRIEQGMMILICPGSIVEPLEMSDDLQVRGMALFNSFPMPFSVDRMPSTFSGPRRDFTIMATKGEAMIGMALLDAVWVALHQETLDQPLMASLVSSMMWLYNSVYLRAQGQKQDGMTAGNNLFDRFIRLVNLFGKKEHRLAFYADKLCVTPRYLGTVVHRESGTTAKEWIDRATLAEAKVLLRHDNAPISHVADELNFPNASFFCKYFKRHTGISPQQYRGGRM